jgi:polyphosphate:AMP phosphotransferase
VFEAAELGQKVGKAEYAEQVPALRVELVRHQMQFRTASFSMVVVLAGDDRPGCNEVLNLLHEWLDPRFLQANAFGEPTQEESERPPFWRYWRALPENGRIGVFLGGWATEGMARRVRKDLDGEGLRRWSDHVCRFEKALVDDGTVVLKVWLHLPRDEWKDRAKDARKDGKKGRRPDDPDAVIFEDYDKGIELAESVLQQTSSGEAPWILVESTDDRSRNLTVARAVLKALSKRLASADADVAQRTIEIARPGVEATRTVLDTVDLTRKLTDEEFDREMAEAHERTERLTLEALKAGISSVLVFEGWDAAGKGGAVRALAGAMDATLYRVVPIAAPNEEERAHHWLWRFWRHLPRRGRMTIFDRSWYGRVLVERVEGLTFAPDWMRAYSEIRDFEEQLLEAGTVLCKFWMHIDKDEQLRRFKRREETPFKQFKITEEDYRNREKRRAY